jgi:hypothetical protein
MGVQSSLKEGMKMQPEAVLSTNSMDDALEKFSHLQELARLLAAKRHQQKDQKPEKTTTEKVNGRAFTITGVR